MSITNRFAKPSIIRALTFGLVAMTLATASILRLGVAQAHAFDHVGVDAGLTNPAHTTGGAIECASGMVRIRQGTLSADAQGYNSLGSTNNFSYVRIDVTLWRWTTQGWQPVRDGERIAWDLGKGQYVYPTLYDRATISELISLGTYTGNPNHQMIFSQLPSGYYTVGLRFNFLNYLNFTLEGSSDWTPNPTDFYPNQGLRYCHI